MSSTLTIHTDGAARGNPGPAAFAFTIARAGAPLIEEKGCLGTMTNNQAEYIALVRALEHATRLGTHHPLRVLSDSELMVKQMRGEYKVKDEGLRTLYEQARELWDRFDDATIRHIRRAENSNADRLCNEALDGERGSSHKPAAASKQHQSPAESPRAKQARGEMLECLKAAANAWSRGDAGDPAPEMVCDQLWDIIGEAGILRKPR